MKPRHALPLLLSLALAPFAASAQESVANCVDLGSDQEVVRSAGGQQIFLRDGQSHYRVGFASSCDSVMFTPTIEISTDGQVNRLCPQGTKVRTKGDTCRVNMVEQISAEEFAKRKKRARH